MVREGRTFEKAAERFAQAAQKEPTNPAHQTCLGCALASRAVYIAYAAAFARNLAWEQADYPRALQAWEAGRDEWEKRKAENPADYAGEKYDDFKPKQPPVRDFVTKDDQAPFRLTPDETSARLSELCQQARQAWDKSVDLAKTADEKAEARYVQAWGFKILHDTLAGWETGTPLSLLGWEKDDDENEASAKDPTRRPKPNKPLSFVPTKEEVLRAAKEAAALAPENALVAQTLGDFLWNTDKPSAIAAYEKAIALAPKNPNLLYRLYQDAIDKDLRAFNEKQNPVSPKGSTPPVVSGEPFMESLDYLRRAQSRDRANAWPLYEEAAIYFRLAPYSLTGPSANRDAPPKEKQAALDAVANNAARQKGAKAVDLITAGNGLPRYALPIYEESVPRLLTQAWNVNTIRLMTQPYFGGFARLRELARSTMGYGQVMVEHENNLGAAVKANRAAIGMGLRIVADWPIDDDIRKGTTVIQGLVGAAISAIGYKGLIQAYTTAGDKEGAEAAQKENDAFQARVADYKKAVNASLLAQETTNGGFPYSVY